MNHSLKPRSFAINVPNDDSRTIEEDTSVTVQILDDPINVNQITKQPEDGTTTTDETTITYTQERKNVMKLQDVQIHIHQLIIPL